MASLDAPIATEVQEAQKRLEDARDILPWFLLSEDLAIKTVLDEERVAVPVKGSNVRGDFLAEYEEGALWIRNAEGKFVVLDKDDYDTLAETYPDSGRPKTYSLGGKYFRLKPTPDAVYDLRMKVYLREIALAAGGTTNEWLRWASELMLAETGRIIALFYIRDAEMAQAMGGAAQVAKRALSVASESRKHAQREYTMGDE